MSDYANGCGCLPRTPGIKCGQSALPVAEDTRVTIHRSQWPDIILTKKPTLKPWSTGERLQQNNDCAGYMGTQIGRILYAQQTGKVIEFSPAALYKLINNRRDAGANIIDAMTASAQYGFLTLDQFGQHNWKAKLPDDWRAKMAVHHVIDWHELASFDGLFSELLMGNPVGIGVKWGRGGHAIPLVEPVWDKSRGYGAKFANSHGASFGDNGYDVMWESELEHGRRVYGAGTARTVTVVE